MFESLPLSFLYKVVGDVWSYIRGRKRRLSAPEKLELRQKWKPVFEKHILERKREGLRRDVIVRDVRRMDDYPVTDDRDRGISSWFRVGLLDTYHRGIMLGLRATGLVEDKRTGGLRYPDRKAGEEPEVKSMLVGYVPFESVESVDWGGDEFYNFPHIYCHFDGPTKQPYEKVAFCERRELNDMEYWSEIAEQKPVLRLTRKRRIRDF